MHRVWWRCLFHFSRIWVIIIGYRWIPWMFSVGKDIWNKFPKSEIFRMGFGVPPFGVLFWWVVTPKDTPSECTLSIGMFVAVNCSYRMCAGFRKNRRFGSGSAHVRNFLKFSRQQTALHLWVCRRNHGDLLYITGVIYFRYYNRFCLAWNRQYTDPGKTEPTSVLRAATFLQIGRHLGERRSKSLCSIILSYYFYWV